MLASQTADGVLSRGTPRTSINWSIGLSAALIVIGLLALFAPFFAGVALEVILAWLLAVAGIGHLALAWHVRGARSHVWEALIGVVYLVAAGYLFLHPVGGLIALTLILSIYLLFKGLFELVAGLTIWKVRGSGWILFDAFFSLILAILIWRQLPFAASWAIGTLTGIAILFTGLSRLALALCIRERIDSDPCTSLCDNCG